MTKSNEAGTPRTIDAKGNIIPKPYGPGRWHSPRQYKCTHEGCENPAELLAPKPNAHNCCGEHEDVPCTMCLDPECEGGCLL